MENIQIIPRAEDVFQPLSEEQKEYKRIQRADRYKNNCTLKQLCLHTIIKDIPSYWSKNISEDGTSPFECLPGIILNEILIEYKKTHKYFEFFNYAKLFITSNLRKIQIDEFKPSRYADLKQMFENAASILLKSIQLKCQNNLRELSVSHCETNKLILDAAIKSLKNLTVLKLCDTTCDDVTMEIISVGMNSLIELNVSHSNVTDDGVLQLCKSNYQELRHLSLHNEDITKFGIFKILDTYPDLLTLGHSDLDKILLKWTNRNPGKRTKLTYLILDSFSPQSNYTPVLEICPDLKDLTISLIDRYVFYGHGRVAEIADTPFPLCCISNLKKIASLHFYFVNPWFSSNTITSVSINSTTFDLIDLLTKFPNIDDLHLESCKIVCTENQILTLDNDLIFSKIKTLHLDSVRGTENENTLYINLLSKIINSKNLESLILNSPLHITSFIPVLSQNIYFKNLTIHSCNSHVIEGIILNNDNIESITISRAPSHVFGSNKCKVLHDCIQTMINGKTKSLRDIPSHVFIIENYDYLLTPR